MTDSPVLLIEQYASQLLDFSSQYGSDLSYSYTASNCLGKPTKFPSYGDFPQAFVLREHGQFWVKCPSGQRFRRPYCHQDLCHRYESFIDLKYDHEVFVNAVYIYETFNPGSVIAIWGGNCRGRWCCLWNRGPNPEPFVGHHPRAFSPPVAMSTFPVQMIRLIFCLENIPANPQIDAVALLGTSSGASSPEIPRFQGVGNGYLLSKVIQENLSCENIFNILSVSLFSIGQSILQQPKNAPDNCYFDSLPREVILKIFSYLDIVTLCRCCQVSSLFHDIGQDPSLYSTLCMRSLFSLISDEMLIKMKTKCSHVTKLDLSWGGNYSKLTSEVLASFIRTCGQHLTHLRLNNCHATESRVFDALSAVSAHSLVELSLANCYLIEASHFNSLANLVNLQHLNLHRTKIGQKQISDIVRRNKKQLKSLIVSCCHQIDGDTLCSLLSHHQPQLECLDMWRVTSLTSAGVSFISQKLHNLRELDLGWCPSVDALASRCISQIAANCPKLVKLFLTAHRHTTDRDIKDMKELQLLEQLDIMGTRHVTFEAVKELLTQLPNLKLLDVTYCDQIETSDNISQLKNMFPECHFVHSFP